MKYISAFAGIGGFEQGLGRAGMEPLALIEWEKHCQTLLKRHYPHINLMGDITDVRGTELGRPDLAVAGFPCQNTSIAAPHRRGLDGSRSHYFFEFTRLVGEYQRVIDETGPRWVVIENPPGLLRSRDGRDMATVVRALEELGYGWAYRVVDGGQLGTPQRRKRVIVVGHRGGDPRPAWQVLGDDGAGGEVAAPRDRGSVESRPGARPIARTDGGLIRVWRKSVNSQVSIERGYEGGYRETWVNDGAGNTLAGHDGGGPLRQKHLIAQAGRLRTLTLTEWERLMGFDSGWTAGIPDSARYTAIGNAMHVGTAEWLGHRLSAVHQALPSLVA